MKDMCSSSLPELLCITEAFFVQHFQCVENLYTAVRSIDKPVLKYLSFALSTDIYGCE